MVPTGSDIVQYALECTTEAEFAELKRMLMAAGCNQWEALGKNYNNWGYLSSNSDARQPIVELTVNMHDSLLELGAKRNPGRRARSPHEAAKLYWDVPEGGAHLMPNSTRLPLRDRAAIIIRDSDRPERPTLSFRDYGIGLSQRDVTRKLLRLQTTKSLTRHLSGTYGKGGMQALMFSEGAVIVSRHQPDLLKGESDLVSVTVIQRRRDERRNAKAPYYAYLVYGRGSDMPGEAFAVAADELDVPFEPGTFISHIGYQTKKLTEYRDLNNQSLTVFLNTMLLRPPLPYKLVDARSPETRKRSPSSHGDIGFFGSWRELISDPKAADPEDEAAAKKMPTYHGSDELLVRFEDESKPRRLPVVWKCFGTKSQRAPKVFDNMPVLFAANGQTHHHWNETRFKQRVPSLSRLADRIAVAVDLSSLHPFELVSIFTSDRTSVLDSNLTRDIERALEDWFNDNADLRAMEIEIARHSAAGNTPVTSEDLDELQALSGGLFSTVPPKKSSTSEPDEAGDDVLTTAGPPVTLLDVPTSFACPTEALQLVPGKHRRFTAYVNGTDGLFKAGTIKKKTGAIADPFTITNSELLNGKTTITIDVSKDAEVGTVFKPQIFFEYSQPDGSVAKIAASIEINIVEAKPRGDHGKTKSASVRRLAYNVALRKAQRPPDHDRNAPVPPGTVREEFGEILKAEDPELYSSLNDDETYPTVTIYTDFEPYLRWREEANSNRSNPELIDQLDREYRAEVASYMARIFLTNRRSEQLAESMMDDDDSQVLPLDEAQMNAMYCMIADQHLRRRAYRESAGIGGRRGKRSVSTASSDEDIATVTHDRLRSASHGMAEETPPPAVVS